MIKYRVHMMESERGWGQDYWHQDFNTRTEAEEHMQKTNAELTSRVVPDYYVKAIKIEIVEV